MWTHGQRIILEQDRSRDRRTDQQLHLVCEAARNHVAMQQRRHGSSAMQHRSPVRVGVALTLGSTATAGVDPDEGDAVSRLADQFGQ